MFESKKQIYFILLIFLAFWDTVERVGKQTKEFISELATDLNQFSDIIQEDTDELSKNLRKDLKVYFSSDTPKQSPKTQSVLDYKISELVEEDSFYLNDPDDADYELYPKTFTLEKNLEFIDALLELYPKILEKYIF